MYDPDEHARTIISNLLRLSNEDHDFSRYLKELTTRLSDWTGFEAVGIRLMDGDDYPYYETLGFPRRFVEMERYLCLRDGGGKIVREPGGMPLLECMCGNVIRGRFDPEKPFFSKRGSFFSNCTTRLLATTTDRDRQARTRNRCNGEGYESVGLVALKAGGRTFGLLQFNDHREGRFEQVSVEVLEEMADIVAATVARKWSEEALRRSEERYRTLFDHMQEGLAYCRMLYEAGRPVDFEYIAVNETFATLTGLKDVVGKRVSAVIPGIRESNPELFEIYGRVASTGQAERFEAFVEPLGIWFSVSAYSPARDHFVAVFENVTERVRAESSLKVSEERYRALFESSRDAIMTLEPPDWRFTSGNTMALSMFGAKSLEEFTALGPWDLSPERQPDGSPSGPRAREIIGKALGRGYLFFEWTHRTLTGKEFPATVLLSRMELGGQEALQGCVRDVSELKEAEAERNLLHEQLLQSQKMEAVGRLAGGVAHDFNNLLTIINNYAELTLDKLPEGHPLHKNLVEILKAGDRAAGLTRQLLTFSRKQVVKPEILDINRVVEGTRSLLRRLIGEDIELKTLLSPDAGRILADPGQVELILMNLAVNARDAMPGGGLLVLETGRAELDDEYAAAHVGVAPGPHVLLSVSDTGCGMDEATRSRIFEPFFTTKEKGKGTGLGLSTVYGIVRQGNGHVWVYSEPGHGTVFKIYWPLEATSAPAPGPGLPSKALSRGTETVLVAEDEKAVRILIEKVLTRAGYTVLSSAGPDEALEACGRHEGPIHLLLTDVIMPKMSGRQLADQVAGIRPETRVLYMSGYTDDAIAHHGVLDPDVRLMAKPFSAATLTRMVRQVLDAG